MSAIATPVKEVEDRYVFVDALRGIAAVAVVVCHLFYSRWLFKSTEIGTFHLFADIALYGARGVQIFFVISGFVIAHSLRRTIPDARGIGNFILRRQVRLDLPYWAVMAGILLLAVIEQRMPFIRHPGTLPAPGDLLLNMTYLQIILGRTPILGVAWTLCIEIQFYLFFMLTLAVTTRRAMAGRIATATLAAVFVTGVAFLAFDPAPSEVKPWMVHYWPYFAAGALAYWSVRRWIPLWVFPVFCVPFAVSWFWSAVPSATITGVATAVVLYAVGLRGKLTSLWKGRGLQYLGRTSYSLYLVHVPVVFLVCQIGFQLTHDTRASAALWYTVAGSASLLVADLFHRCIEQPSMRLASRFKRRPAGRDSSVAMVPQEILPASGSVQ